MTQSGTNLLHGSLFEFMQQRFRRENYYDNTVGTPPFKRNQFGARWAARSAKIRSSSSETTNSLSRGWESVPSLCAGCNMRQGLLPCGGGLVNCASGAAIGTPTLVPG